MAPFVGPSVYTDSGGAGGANPPAVSTDVAAWNAVPGSQWVSMKNMLVVVDG